MTGRVALINMPFASLNLPAIGISLLQSALHRDEIPCDVHDLNLRFGSRISAESYHRIAEASPTIALVGEWIFAEAAFGTDGARDRAYEDSVMRKRFSTFFSQEIIDEVRVARVQAAPFLEECQQSIDWSKYQIVGFTSSFQQHVAAIALAERIKRRHAAIDVVFGGANCEGEMGAALLRQFSFVDAVCTGEGDISFPEYVRRTFAQTDRRVPGMFTREAGGEVIIPAPSVPLRDLDALPYPSFDHHYAQAAECGIAATLTPIVPFETSRGCWWGVKQHCTFCGLNGGTMAYRSKSASRALDEIMTLGSRYGNHVLLVDNIVDLNYLDTFFPALEARQSGITMFVETKVNLRKDQLAQLARAGVRYLQPGIESLSTSVLRLMRKGCTMLQNVQLLKWCKEMGVRTIWNFLHGFPGENSADYDDAAALIPRVLHLDPPGGVGRIRLDRFSPYFVAPEAYGITNVKPQETYAHIFPFDESVLRDLVYYFEFDYDESPETARSVSTAVDQINAWRKSDNRASLTWCDSDGTLVVRDARCGGSVTEFALEGESRETYLFCDRIRSLDAIHAHLTAKNPRTRARDVRRIVSGLVESSLSIIEGNAVLSLATPTRGVRLQKSATVPANRRDNQS
ncbi:2-hydroxyethylphosphonate methyltransferase [Planctomycetaceae bacterium]|nr:2-hydroxyethylphosphonate methyltransferase [Planctomycetaceae bacterium]